MFAIVKEEPHSDLVSHSLHRRWSISTFTPMYVIYYLPEVHKSNQSMRTPLTHARIMCERTQVITLRRLASVTRCVKVTLEGHQNGLYEYVK